MADNHTKKTKKKRRSHIKDGVVLKVSDIEKECDRLRRRPRAALYPLLPITEPLKLKRKSIHVKKGRRRHRKHCRKRKDEDGVQKKRLPVSRGLDSRTRLVTTATTSGSEVSSLACSRNLTAQHNQKSSVGKPHWASAELFYGGDTWLDVPRAPLAVPEHPRHHHYHTQKKHKHRICHHDPLLCGHRTSVTTSLKDLRRLSHLRHHRRCADLEAGIDDKDSATSNSRSRKIVSFIIMSVASFILLMCVALVAVTLRLTPAIDELGKHFYRIYIHIHIFAISIVFY